MERLQRQRSSSTERLLRSLCRTAPLPRIRAVVEKYIRYDPLLLTRHDSRGRIPVHHALSRFEFDPTILEYLVRRCPESVRIKTKDGQEKVALHLYLTNKSYSIRLEGIRILTDAWPGALLVPCADGSLPLHLLAQVEFALLPIHLDVFRLMVRLGPMAVRAKDGNGNLPIHCLFDRETRDAGLREVQFLADLYPDSLLVRDGDGYLPIHIVANSRSVCRDLFTLLVTECPESVRVRMPDGRSVLHALVSVPKGITVAHLVVNVWPESLVARDGDGDIPLHTAARSGEAELVRFLLDQSPETAQYRGKEGSLPLHVAAQHQSLGTVQLLVELCPETVNAVDDAGRTPLHLAVRDPIHLCSTEMKVRYLTGLAPLALGTRDKKGRLPLHSAVDQESMLTYPEKTDVLLAVVQFLIDHRPDALLQGDLDGNLPLHIAASRYVAVPVLSLLINHRPQVLRARNGHGLLPVHMAMHRFRSETLTQHFNFCNGVIDCYMNHEVESVHFLVKQWPESLLERHPKGGTLLHRAFDGPDTPGRRVVLPLLQNWPGSSIAVDDQGLLPVHTAAAADEPLDVLYSMLLTQHGVLRAQTGCQRERPQPLATTDASDRPLQKKARTGN